MYYVIKETEIRGDKMMYIKDSYLILENEILYGNFKIIEGKIATIDKTNNLSKETMIKHIS